MYCQCGCGQKTKRAKQRKVRKFHTYEKGDYYLYVNGHYSRPKKDPIERFMGFVHKMRNGCWFWLGTKPNGRYGMFRLDGEMLLAHRAAWILFHGEIPEGMNVCHTCDVEQCANPEHLWLGTQKENVQDCIQKGRRG